MYVNVIRIEDIELPKVCKLLTSGSCGREIDRKGVCGL